jgi:uncharacterized protein (TIRG00374 family)
MVRLAEVMLRRKASLLITLVVISIFLVYFFLNLDKFSALLHVNVFLLFLIAIAYLSTIAANGLFIKFILEPFDKYISVKESTYVAMISSVGNFFAPIGSGFGFRAVYLKKKHGLAYSDYIATLYGNYVIVFLINSFFALVALYLLRDSAGRGYFTLVLLFAGMFAVTFLLTIIRIPTLKKELNVKNKHLRFVATGLLDMATGWNRIVKNKRLLLHLLAVTTFNFIVTLLIAWLEITALHFSISFPALLLFGVLGSLSLFINITPANLGVKEAIYLFSSAVIGLTAPQILSIALIDRGVLFAVLFCLWLYFTKYKHPTGDKF